jgi:hypothetical protein
LFNIVSKKQAKLADVLCSIPLNVEFRRALVRNKLLEWNHLVAIMANVNLQQGNGIFVWTLQKTCLFTNFMYRYLVINVLKVSQIVWQLKIHLKIEIFLWFFKREIILTKDNLVKRNWNGDKSCCFCNKPKTIQHLFFQCSHAKFLWRSVHMVLGIKPPRNAQNLFNDWLFWKDETF